VDADKGAPHVPRNSLGMYRISGTGWPDIRPILEAGSISGRNGYLNRIVTGPFWRLLDPSNQLPGVITEHEE